MYETASHMPYIIGGIGNYFVHEADWEMVQIAIRLNNSVDPENKVEWIQPWAATAAQHNYGQTLAWRLNGNGPGITDQRYVQIADNGNRLKIYIGENSHATYFREGKISTPESPSVSLGTQVQYEELTVSYDRLLRPDPITDYGLLSLERHDSIGIYDWTGGWGGNKYRGSFYNEKSDRDGKFRVVSDPVRFHERCRKLIGNDLDPETELR
jgi:hypothetical protein